MTEHNRIESDKLNDSAKWVIRQLLLEIETRNTEIELYDAEQDGYVICYRLIVGEESVVKEFTQKLSIKKQGNRLEVRHGKN